MYLLCPKRAGLYVCNQRIHGLCITLHVNLWLLDMIPRWMAWHDRVDGWMDGWVGWVDVFAGPRRVGPSTEG